MESGNSGSLQSSSAGDEEYDSRAAVESVSAFMSGGPISNPPPPQPPVQFFDPLSNYMQLHHNPNSPLLNPSLAWPRNSTTTLRSDPNPVSHDIINPMFSSSPTFTPSFQAPAAVGLENINTTTLAPPQQNQNQAAARNPKKRSRASRRAPTTVLTTDTTNFRAMVQEFTGIPAPPFSNSSFPRNRLDLFGTRSSTSLDTAHPPPYLRRPFAQKVQPPLPFLASSSSLFTSSAAIDGSSTTNNITSSSTPAINNYQITQSSNLYNIPNPILSSLLQTNPKFPFSNSPLMGSSKPSFEIPSNKMGGLDEQFGLGHGNHVSANLSGLPNLIPSEQIALRNDHNDNPASQDGNKDNSRAVNGNYNLPRNTILNGKMNYSASSTSNFHGEKGPENVAARGEGMVESWICSSSD